MVKSVLGVNHPGLRDWLIQRITAVVLAVYFVGLIYFFVHNPNLDYADWHRLFAKTWMKIATLFALISLLFHSWVGMWTILTDYVKPYGLRFILHFAVFLALVIFFFAGLLILWDI